MITHDVISPQKMKVVPIARPAGKKFGRGSDSGGSGSQSCRTVASYKGGPSRAVVRLSLVIKFVIYWRAGSLLRQPAGELCDDRAQINHTHRHPHQKSADLLIALWSDAPVHLD